MMKEKVKNNFPKSIDIEGFIYSVTYFDNKNDVLPQELRRDIDDNAEGYTNFEDQIIRIYRGPRPDYGVLQTLWHEICHIIVHIHHLDDANIEEIEDENIRKFRAVRLEGLIDQFASGITYVQSHNELGLGK